jgi:hypothetical protein
MKNRLTPRRQGAKVLNLRLFAALRHCVMFVMFVADWFAIVGTTKYTKEGQKTGSIRALDWESPGQSSKSNPQIRQIFAD